MKKKKKKKINPHWGWKGGDPLSGADVDFEALGGDERAEALRHGTIRKPKEKE